jgi:hypothetical protein
MTRNDYSDITSPIDEAPAWWDGNVPHYAPFHPGLMTNASEAFEVALVRGACQICGVEYLSTVCGYTAAFERAAGISESRWLPGWDPPLALKHLGDCDGGPFMSSNPLAVSEYWRRKGSEWCRTPEFEFILRH